jgi:hypothetical protein
MEDVMSRYRTIHCTVAAAALGASLFAGHAHADAKAHFTDVLKPHGHQRGRAEEIVDAQACGASRTTINTILPVFQKCMWGKGWVLDRLEPDPESRPDRGTLSSYSDIRGDGTGHQRSDAALDSDTRLCEARVGDDGSARFRQCMAGRGWKFLFAQHAPAQRREVPSYDDAPSSSPPSDPTPTGPDTAGMNTPTNPTWRGFE